MPKLIDAHTHAHFAAYGDESEEVVQRALDEDIWMVTVGTQKDTSRAAVELAEKYDEGVYASIALHPIHTDKSYHDPKELGEGGDDKGFTSRGEEFDYEYYRSLGRSSKVVAIGECGLDYYRLSQESKDRQVKAFLKQMELAKELELPLMIHCREAFPDLIDLLKDNEDLLREDLPGVNHFFTGTPEDAKALKDFGFYFTFGGVITFTRDYDEAIKEIGLDRIMVETDAPYVAPEPHRGKRNEPAFVKYTTQKLADILGVSFDEAAEKTVENTRRVFGI